VVGILGLRLIAGVFVSVYIINDVTVVILAAFQAVAVLAWIRYGDAPVAAPPPHDRRPSEGA